MTNLRGGVDKVELDLFQIFPHVVGDERLPKDNRPLPDAHAAALDDDKVVSDFSVMGEPADRVDRLVGEVHLGRAVVLVDFTVVGGETLADSVDFFVDLNSMMVTFLTASGDGVADPGWMPGTDTSDFPETSVGLPWELFSAPPGSDTLPTVTLGDSTAVQDLVHFENVSNWNVLLEKPGGKVDFLSDVAAAVDLEL